ncbi:MAG TPA: dTDP-4-dehydrorhamnose reductase [Mycobacteriales bacterium]
MRFLVTAAGGQLGADLVRVAGDPSAGHEVVALTRAELAVTDPAAVEKAVVDVRPDLVLNAAAYTAVDAAETDEAAAALVNADAPANLARVCALHDAGLVHVSTDYVFDGTADRPYEVDAPTGPTSAYGRTKLAGEQAVRSLLPERSWVVRTAWVYGESGGNFVRTMVKLAGIKETLDVVDDQRGSPTWSRDLAAGLLALAAARPAPGIYHCTNSGETTWYGLARAVFEEIGADPERVRPTTTDRFPRPAPRPAYSVLSGAAWTAAGLPPPRPWRDALHAAFTEVGDAFRR